MGSEQRTWSGLGWALVAGCMAFAICCGMTATVAQSRRLAPVQKMSLVVPKACLIEFYAYAKVAEAAEDMGGDGDVLDFALDDLQASVVECLRNEDGADERDASDDNGWPWLKAERRARLVSEAGSCSVITGSRIFARTRNDKYS